MSKDRAVRRAAREAELAAQAQDRARRTVRSARWDRAKARVAALVSPLRRRSRGGALAARRRRTVGLMVFGFVGVQALTWAVTPDWGTRVAILLVSLFAAPVVAVFVL